jgi:threonine dehydrogenase-like Zn-dependent dehydrogenase
VYSRQKPLGLRYVTITTGLVDASSTPILTRLIAHGRLDPTIFAMHRFKLNQMIEAYDTFANTAHLDAIKALYPPRLHELPNGIIYIPEDVIARLLLADP